MTWIDFLCITTHTDVELWLHEIICAPFLQEVELENLFLLLVLTESG